MEKARNERLECIKIVLKEFDEQNINYCILRNYEFLLGNPMPIESLDTVVSKKDFRRADKILKDFDFIKRKQQFSLKHKAYFRLIDLQKVSFDIQIGGIHWNDMVYLDESILENRKKIKYFYALSDKDTFVMLLVHSILGKRYFKPKYQKTLVGLYDQVDNNYVYSKISKIFNKKFAKFLMQSVKINKFNRINCYKLIIIFLIKKPIRFITFFLLTLRWIKQRKNPFRLSPLISVIGPDGAGKSTMVKNLKYFLESNGRKISLIYTGRGRENILPIAYFGRKYKKKEKKRDKVTGDFYKHKKASLKRRVLYTLSCPIFALDLYLRYLFKILPERRKGKIVITDRYCSDIILMKNVPSWLKNFFLTLFPKPTINIFLYNDPETLHQRRPEEPINELERQMSIFGKLNYDMKIKSTDQKKDYIEIINFIQKRLLENWF